MKRQILFFLLVVSLLVTGCDASPGEDEKPVADPVPLGQPSSRWKIAFQDEFGLPVLNPAKWSYGFGWGPTSGSFGEIPRAANISIVDGILKIKVEKEGSTFFSGAINTKNKFSQQFGYWEARIKAARGKGMLSAFWGKSQNEAWPPELDIVEILGREPTISHHTIHFKRNGANASTHNSFTGPDFSSDFHVFGVSWTPEVVIYYVDGVERVRVPGGGAQLDNDQPFYTMLNVHVGHEWPGWPDASTVFPAVMEVDYVRVWSLVTPAS